MSEAAVVPAVALALLHQWTQPGLVEVELCLWRLLLLMSALIDEAAVCGKHETSRVIQHLLIVSDDG